MKINQNEGLVTPSLADPWSGESGDPIADSDDRLKLRVYFYWQKEQNTKKAESNKLFFCPSTEPPSSV